MNFCEYAQCKSKVKIDANVIQMRDADNAKKGDTLKVGVCKNHLSTLLRDAERNGARVDFQLVEA